MSERFYHPEVFQKDTSVFLESSEEHHLRKVMRIRVGKNIELVNGMGEIAQACVNESGLKIISVKKMIQEEGIHLGVPFMRPSKLELIIEKGTEIGVSSFLFYPAVNSTLKSLSSHQIKRLNSILISALKQSKRAYLPYLEILSSLDEILEKEPSCFYGDIRETAGTISFPKTSIIFISGPESGFSEDEVSLLERKAKGIKINGNILRAETAPLVASSLFAYQSLF